jgi:hypothetical protein
LKQLAKIAFNEVLQVKFPADRRTLTQRSNRDQHTKVERQNYAQLISARSWISAGYFYPLWHNYRGRSSPRQTITFDGFNILIHIT